jgi:S1-C subfamily serine protease
VDACGRIVGVTTAILTEAQNIGFAVPINLVRDVVPWLVKSGRLVRPWLGVQGQFVAPELKELQGGLFELTVQGQPVLLGGDIITEVNGTALSDPDTLAKTLGNLQVGSALSMTLMRGGKKQHVDLTLTERPVMASQMLDRRFGAAASGPGHPASRRGRSAARTFIF